ncbi:MAG: hypothetical protein IMZ62_12735 [Chloroflexi bacterium]|nr:hypothetical protein [Chloroflexota bacterium]MBE3117514.1 hypothetical protein [Candidatus Atribacteria bacterium]
MSTRKPKVAPLKVGQEEAGDKALRDLHDACCRNPKKAARLFAQDLARRDRDEAFWLSIEDH